ncbi:hypothetical protein LXL04_015352 [Taraxacum kok-saghyz]
MVPLDVTCFSDILIPLCRISRQELIPAGHATGVRMVKAILPSARMLLSFGFGFLSSASTSLRIVERVRWHLRAVQMRTIIGFENGGTNLGHLFHFAADQFSVAGALSSAQHI